MEDHAKLQVFMGEEGGALVYLSKATSIEQVTDAGNIRIDTLSGMSGFSDGAGSVKVNIGYAIPLGGPEFPFQQACANKAYVTVQLGVGAEAYVGTGKINTETVSQSTNAASEGKIEWEGELKARE
jgi:hypothetical protein